MYDEWIAVLRASSLFSGIGPEALLKMLECLKPRMEQRRQREIVAIVGQPFHGVGIVASGRVALTKETYSGNRVILNILGPGEIFGEMVAFSDGRVWPVTVVAQDDSSLLFLPADKILGSCANRCASHQTLIMNTMRILSSRAIMLSKKIEHLSARSNRGKVSNYLLDVCRETGKTEFEVPMKRHELADYLVMPRPSLSRELCLLRDDGIIEFAGSRVKVKDRLRLEASID